MEQGDVIVIGAGVAALSVVSLAACAAAVSAKKKANK